MNARVLLVLPLLACAELESLLEDVADVSEEGGVCAGEAFRGNIFRNSALDNTYDYIGTFEDMIFRADEQRFEAQVEMSMLGIDAGENISTNCGYTGVAQGAVSGATAAGMQFTGIALVQSAYPDQPGCLAEPQRIDIQMVVPFACDAVDGEWVHDPDDSYGSGQGHFSATEVYPRSEVVGGDEDPGDEVVDDGDGDGDGDEEAVNAQQCPLNTQMHFAGPLSAINGCTAELHTLNVIDASGHLSGEMWLEDASGNCELTEGALDAQVSEDGRIVGTASGEVVAHAGVQLLDGCQQMVDGWFRINEWDDEDLANFELERIE